MAGNVRDTMGAFGSYPTGLALYEKATSQERDWGIIKKASLSDL